MTPKLLMIAMTLTPIMLMIVVKTTSSTASTTAFLAPSGVLYEPMSFVPPTISNAPEICGRITW